MNILVTGGAGFIGSCFVRHMLNKYPDYKIINIDALTYAGNIENLNDVKDNPNYTFVHGNICDKKLVRELMSQVDCVVNFAAESHVDRSITGPEIFIETNVQGTLNLLQAAKEANIQRYLQVSTDEVYGTLGKTGYFYETTPLAPNSPYSASKASSDFLVRAYHHTFGMNVTTSNCSNNYGPKQHNEKLIPHIISKALAKQPLPVYGKGLNIRDWLYVLDHCKAIDLIYHEGKAGETYNVGGRNERNNLQIVNRICSILDDARPRKEGKYADLITFVADRPGHDLRYAIDATKLETELNWKADENFDTGILKTVEWYLK